MEIPPLKKEKDKKKDQKYTIDYRNFRTIHEGTVVHIAGRVVEQQDWRIDIFMSDKEQIRIQFNPKVNRISLTPTKGVG